MWTQILVLIIGFTLLVSGANFLVKGASSIAKKLHISEILIGLTIVSVGTTLPELVVSIVSAASNNADLVLGNVIGSNLCNLLLILGAVTILKPIKFEKETIKKNLPLLVLLNIIILIMGLGIFKSTSLILTKVEGIILLSIAVLYFLFPIITFLKENRKAKTEKENEKNNLFVIKQMALVLLGGIALKFGGDFAVSASTSIAKILGISERVIGLTIVAIGTSLPELITSVVAIFKGNEDIAEGNIIGACIINSCLVLGAGAVINNITMATSYIGDLVLLMFCIGLIWMFGSTNKENEFKRSNGAVLIVIYLIYLLRLIIIE